MKTFKRNIALLYAVITFGNIGYAQTFDTIWITKPNTFTKVEGEACYVLLPLNSTAAGTNKSRRSSIGTRVDGTITYDYLYRSLVDTPFYTKNFQQHTLSGNIRTTVKGIYPVDVRFNVRKSNQPFLQNLFDISLGLNPQQMADNIKQQIIQRYKRVNVDSALYALEQKLIDYGRLQYSLDSLMNARNKMQERVELREALFEQFPHLPLPEIDSLIDGVGHNKINSLFSYDNPELGRKLMEYRKTVTEKLRIQEIKDSVLQITNGISKKKQEFEQYRNELPDVNKVMGTKELSQFLKSKPAVKDSLPRNVNMLLAIKTFSIGRGILNYSELTAKDIAITGLNAEVNPSWYGAAAMGVINWQFRPFGVKNRRLPNQYAGIFRAGWGLTERAAIIFTYYRGARNLVYAPLPDSIPVPPIQRMQGISAQLLYKINARHSLSFEYAKSSIPANQQSLSNEKNQYHWLSFEKGSRTNEAISLIYDGHITKTNTQINARYRHLGADFQCFTFFNTQANRHAWQWDVNQKIGRYFYARGGMQKNQVSFPGVENLRTDVVLAKAQVGFSKPQLPSVFIGFMPSSQLMLVDSVPFENNFQTLNAVATYAWRTGEKLWLSQVNFTRFFNSGSDTGFIYFNASDVGVSQQVSMGKWQFQAGYHLINQGTQRLHTMDGGLSLVCKANLTFSCNGRMNTLQDGNRLYGYGGGMQWQIGRFGSLSLQAERNYFPNLKKGLEPFETGRLTFMKTL